MGIDFGASHAIGHTLGGTADVPHGHTSCVMLPAVLRYNDGVDSLGGKMRLIAEIFGSPGESASAAVAKFIADLGMPSNLQQVGVRTDMFQTIARLSMKDPWIKTNP